MEVYLDVVWLMVDVPVVEREGALPGINRRGEEKRVLRLEREVDDIALEVGAREAARVGVFGVPPGSGAIDDGKSGGVTTGYRMMSLRDGESFYSPNKSRAQ